MTDSTPFPTRQVWYLTGSQGLYGEETLRQVADQSGEIAATLAAGLPVQLVVKPVLTDASAIHRVMLEANADDACIGVIAWMHTFSPAKMWIAGLDALRKPLLHLHTQANVQLPWSTIDMDFMNLNQAAHGDREFGYIQSRLGVARKTVAGHVSDLGRAETKLARLQVGSSEAADAALSVFEAPQDPPMQGMLGVAWLRDKQVIVDYDAYRLGFPATAADSRVEDERLIARGYVPHKMTWDTASGTFSVKGAVNGVATDLRVNTVSNNVIDTGFAQTAGIQLGPVVDQNGGPAGALVDSFLSKRLVSITVDGQDTAPTQPLIFDYYAYESGKRPAVPGKDGTVTIGAEFMLANRAVIDFGTQTLLIAPR